MDKDKLISKYLKNDLSAGEWKELEMWLNESHTNRATLTKLESYWKNDENEIQLNRDEVWHQLSDRIAAEEVVSTRKNLYQHLYFYMKIAAVLVLVATASFVTFQHSQTGLGSQQTLAMAERTALPGQKITVALPDGSLVMLNAASQIVFPEQFDRDKREVELTGEAFFEVQHDPSRPFLVKSKGSVVKVLGTSFNVRTYPDEEEISVAVATGKVLFSGPKKGSEVVLEPEEMALYNGRSKQLIKSQVDKQVVFGWKDKILYFENEDFDEIIKELERWYGIEINAVGNFSEMGKFSGEFKNKSLEHVLIGLSYLYEFDYEIENDIVTLK